MRPRRHPRSWLAHRLRSAAGAAQRLAARVESAGVESARVESARVESAGVAARPPEVPRRFGEPPRHWLDLVTAHAPGLLRDVDLGPPAADTEPRGDGGPHDDRLAGFGAAAPLPHGGPGLRAGPSDAGTRPFVDRPPTVGTSGVFGTSGLPGTGTAPDTSGVPDAGAAAGDRGTSIVSARPAQPGASDRPVSGGASRSARTDAAGWPARTGTVSGPARTGAASWPARTGAVAWPARTGAVTWPARTGVVTWPARTGAASGSGEADAGGDPGTAGGPETRVVGADGPRPSARSSVAQHAPWAGRPGASDADHGVESSPPVDPGRGRTASGPDRRPGTGLREGGWRVGGAGPISSGEASDGHRRGTRSPHPGAVVRPVTSWHPDSPSHPPARPAAVMADPGLLDDGLPARSPTAVERSGGRGGGRDAGPHGGTAWDGVAVPEPRSGQWPVGPEFTPGASAVDPWPALPDDEPLWTVAASAPDAARLARLDREQAGD